MVDHGLPPDGLDGSRSPGNRRHPSRRTYGHALFPVPRQRHSPPSSFEVGCLSSPRPSSQETYAFKSVPPIHTSASSSRRRPQHPLRPSQEGNSYDVRRFVHSFIQAQPGFASPAAVDSFYGNFPPACLSHLPFASPFWALRPTEKLPGTNRHRPRSVMP